MTNPCGCNSKEQAKGFAALVYLTENYRCEDLSISHLMNAMNDRKKPAAQKRVTEYVRATGAIPNLKGNKFRIPLKFIDTSIFKNALSKKLCSPQIVIENEIVDNPEIKHLFRKIFWKCGWRAVSITNSSDSKNTNPYYHFEIDTKKRLSEPERDRVRDVFVKKLSSWAGKPFDPQRIIVTPGRDIKTTILDIHKPKVNGKYKEHEEIIPSIHIKILPPPCRQKRGECRLANSS